MRYSYKSPRKMYAITSTWKIYPYHEIADRLPTYAMKPLDIADSTAPNFGRSSLANIFSDMVWPAVDLENWPLPVLASLYNLSKLTQRSGDPQRAGRVIDQIEELCFDRAINASSIEVVDVETVIAQWQAQDRKPELEKKTKEEVKRMKHSAASVPKDVDKAKAVVKDKTERHRRAVLRKRAIRDTNLDLEDLDVKIEGATHTNGLKYQRADKKRKLLGLEHEEADYVEFWSSDGEEEERPVKKARVEGQHVGK